MRRRRGEVTDPRYVKRRDRRDVQVNISPGGRRRSYRESRNARECLPRYSRELSTRGKEVSSIVTRRTVDRNRKLQVSGNGGRPCCPPGEAQLAGRPRIHEEDDQEGGA